MLRAVERALYSQLGCTTAADVNGQRSRAVVPACVAVVLVTPPWKISTLRGGCKRCVQALLTHAAPTFRARPGGWVTMTSPPASCVRRIVDEGKPVSIASIATHSYTQAYGEIDEVGPVPSELSRD